MPSKIEKLIAKWRGKENHAVGNLAERFRCADELERAYREEVLPLVDALRKFIVVHAHDCPPEVKCTECDLARLAVKNALAVLRSFDVASPAPEEPKQ